MSDNDDTRRRLQELESEIAQLRGDAGLDADPGSPAEPRDQADIAAANNNLEETEALLRVLEQRRETLLEQLGGS
jgi:hypothetical protein